MQKIDSLLAIEKSLASLPPTLRSLILKRLRSLTQYEPVIGIMGIATAPVVCFQVAISANWRC